MWNFRAYEERDFYRVDHFIAAMGVLCHPNFEEEKSNGVGVSIDPIYDTDSTFYLNTQVGESLITNPDPNSVPEEILLYEDTSQGAGYLVLRLSNLVNPGELVMDQVYLDLMREYLTVIHDEFALLYDVVGAEGFGMDIEYKVTAQDQLIIKQARPWVSFWADIKANNDLGVTEIVNPQSSSSLGSNELVTARIANKGLNDMNDFNISLVVDGQLIETITITDTIKPFTDADFQFSVPQDFSTLGDYNITGIVTDIEDEYGNNDTLNLVLSKIHLLDGELSIGQLTVLCDDEVEAVIRLTNHGETTINDVEIEVVVNGMVVDNFNATVDIPFQEQDNVTIIIDDNLQLVNNNITLNLVNVNNQLDGDLTNNSATTTTSLDSDYDIITLIINPDDYPYETSWEVYDEGENKTIASGALHSGTQVFSEDICLNYGSCFSLFVYDSFGDGICCDYGFGNFLVLNSSGNTIVYNNGEFGNEAKEVFCPDGTGCGFTADINVSNTTSASTNDGAITINTNSGLSPFQYSINGGQTFIDSSTFVNLATGYYTVFILGATGLCSYQETVLIEACTFTTVDIAAAKVSSVVTADGSIVITPTSGVGPYQYSIDGGQNFDTSNVFPNLAVGTYNVVVQDASDICLYEVSVPIEVDPFAVGIGNDGFSKGIKIYPNPTLGNFTIEGAAGMVTIYDIYGRLVLTANTHTLDISNTANGIYFVRVTDKQGRVYVGKVLKE
jgi:hypothetical protein